MRSTYKVLDSRAQCIVGTGTRMADSYHDANIGGRGDIDAEDEESDVLLTRDRSHLDAQLDAEEQSWLAEASAFTPPDSREPVSGLTATAGAAEVPAGRPGHAAQRVHGANAPGGALDWPSAGVARATVPDPHRVVNVSAPRHLPRGRFDHTQQQRATHRSYALLQDPPDDGSEDEALANPQSVRSATSGAGGPPPRRGVSAREEDDDGLDRIMSLLHSYGDGPQESSGIHHLSPVPRPQLTDAGLIDSEDDSPNSHPGVSQPPATHEVLRADGHANTDTSVFSTVSSIRNDITKLRDAPPRVTYDPLTGKLFATCRPNNSEENIGSAATRPDLQPPQEAPSVVQLPPLCLFSASTVRHERRMLRAYCRRFVTPRIPVSVAAQSALGTLVDGASRRVNPGDTTPATRVLTAAQRSTTPGLDAGRKRPSAMMQPATSASPPKPAELELILELRALRSAASIGHRPGASLAPPLAIVSKAPQPPGRNGVNATDAVFRKTDGVAVATGNNSTTTPAAVLMTADKNRRPRDRSIL
jgi:hypothetical protein